METNEADDSKATTLSSEVFEMNQPAHPPAGPKHTILIDDAEFQVEQQTVSGAQIKAVAGIAADYQLFLEQPGEDKLIGDNESIKLHNQMKFYSLPPATFG